MVYGSRIAAAKFSKHGEVNELFFSIKFPPRYNSRSVLYVQHYTPFGIPLSWAKLLSVKGLRDKCHSCRVS